MLYMCKIVYFRPSYFTLLVVREESCEIFARDVILQTLLFFKARRNISASSRIQPICLDCSLPPPRVNGSIQYQRMLNTNAVRDYLTGTTVISLWPTRSLPTIVAGVCSYRALQLRPPPGPPLVPFDHLFTSSLFPFSSRIC